MGLVPKECLIQKQNNGNDRNCHEIGSEFLVIVFVIDIFDVKKNGTTMTARRFAEYLRKKGHEVRVVSTGEPAPDKFLVPEKHTPIVNYFSQKQNFVFARTGGKHSEKSAGRSGYRPFVPANGAGAQSVSDCPGNGDSLQRGLSSSARKPLPLISGWETGNGFPIRFTSGCIVCFTAILTIFTARPILLPSS